MLDVNLWIKNPYPFRYQEYTAIAEVLRRIYGSNPIYLREYPVDRVSVDDVNITTARKMADTVKCFHLQAALKDLDLGYYGAKDAPALHVEVEILGVNDRRPEWAREKQG